ncbi:hypothetical protein CSC94_12650 [Zhengella mangrovi]|uniref:VRR-NUC domain-containing protein n=1 Tax=Zhengella mangrovi TaxID=1982044 RepID=A0A2G1QLX4_9HYPH|nr:VRR-NUC domain-containing protein [Zhengella mangrovi]PHP66535.1 hypothetical protein CSC94_12650 [Zhengella mangrovi]
MTRVRRTPEGLLQQAVVEFLDLALPAGFRAFHIPNEGKRSKIAGAIARKEGLRAGVPDLCIVRHGGWCAFIELKHGQKKPTEEQVEFLDWCAEHAIPAAVCRSVEGVRDQCREWGIPLKGVAR